MSSDGRGYMLPEIITPQEYTCVQIQVPTDVYHQAAFWGALDSLGRWYNWQRDDDKRGKDAAAVWRPLVAAARENICEGTPMEFDLQQVGCGIVLFVDGIQAASLTLDLSACGIGPGEPDGIQDLRVVEGVLQAQDADNTWRDIVSLCEPECGYVVIYFYDQNCPLNATDITIGTRLSGGELAPDITDNGVLAFENLEFEFPFASPADIKAVSIAWQHDYDADLESINISIGSLDGNIVWGVPWVTLGEFWPAGNYSHVWEADEPQTVTGIKVSVDITYLVENASPGFTIRDMGINGTYPMATWDDNGTTRRIDYGL